MSGSTTEFDTVLELCSDRHRRIALAVLAEESRSMTLNDLTKTIVKRDRREPITEVSEDVVMRIRLSLHHEHVPKLAAKAPVEYDRERGLVEPTESFDRLEPHLSAILEADPALEPPVEL